MIGTRQTLRVRIHARDPGRVLSQCLAHGSLSDVGIGNMDEQAGRIERPLGTAPELPQGTRGVVAAAEGEGFAEIFRSLSGEVILAIDRARGPGLDELLDLVQTLPRSEIVVLANHPAAVRVVESIRPLPDKRLSVVESEIGTARVEIHHGGRPAPPFLLSIECEARWYG